jgi:hypothetical protein
MGAADSQRMLEPATRQNRHRGPTGRDSRNRLGPNPTAVRETAP